MRAHLARRHALDFNSFDFLRRDELGLSEVLRWLLDPYASHGQGDLFLRKFLDQCGITDQPSTECAIAETEVPTYSIVASARRIDVQVRYGDFILAIENKPFASYQPRQLLDYLDHLSNVSGNNHCLVVLNSSHNEIPADQLSERQRARFIADGRLICRRYEQLETWLTACEAKCEAIRVRQLLSEFRDYIAHHWGVGSSMAEQDFLVEGLLSEPGRRIAAIDLLSVYDDFLDKLHDRFVLALENTVADFGWSVSLDENDSEYPIVVEFGDPIWAFGLVISWEAIPPYFGMIVKTPKKDVEHPKAKLARIAGAFGKSKPNGWKWPWWQQFNRSTLNGLDPNDFASVWRSVDEKTELVEWIIRQARKAKKALV